MLRRRMDGGGYSQTFPHEFSQNAWPDQLVMYQAMYNTDDVHVSYLDEENDEIPITCQDELDYAYQVSNSTQGVLKLILRNSRQELIDKLKLNIDPQVLKKIDEKSMASHRIVTDFNLSTSIDSRITAFAREITEHLPAVIETSSNETQTSSGSGGETRKEIEDYVNSRLDKFKQSFYQDLDVKIKSIIESNVSQKLAECKEMIMLESFSGTSCGIQQLESMHDLEAKVNKLFEMIADAKKTGRGIKSALLEEELQSTGAFMAEFIADTNIPDGTVCPPGAKFQKEWQIKNTGKLDWTKSAVKLSCIGGTIFNVNTSVSVEDTPVGQTASIRADMVAPNYTGSYFSEWVLTCSNGTIQFGPRVWCTIKVDAEPPTTTTTTTEMTESNQQLVNLMSSSSSSTKTTPSPSEFELHVNKASSMCDESQQQQQYQQEIDDDLDDEFVVVPDCFDLNKKWVISKREDHEEEETATNNLVMIKEGDQSTIDMLNESVDIVDAANNTTIVSDQDESSSETGEGDEEGKDSEATTTSRSESAALVVEEHQQSSSLSANQNISMTSSSIDIPIRKLNIADELKQLEARGCVACAVEETHEHTAAPISPSTATAVSPGSAAISAAMEKTLTALDKMKNAFSNLGTPSFVTTGLDLNTSSTSPSDPSSTDRPTETSQLKTMLLNQNRLLAMGFGNRALNERLLKKYNMDVDKVVEHLVDRSDNDWMDSR